MKLNLVPLRLLCRTLLIALTAAMGLMLSMPHPAWASGEQERQLWRQQQRVGVQQAIRERQIQRQERQLERQQAQEQMQGQRRQELGSAPPANFNPNENPDNRIGPGRLTLEQRQALRRQIQEAGRSVYQGPDRP